MTTERDLTFTEEPAVDGRSKYPIDELALKAASIASAAGIAPAAVTLVENDDGSFTAMVGDRSCTGAWEHVLAWAKQAAAQLAEFELSLEHLPPANDEAPWMDDDPEP